MKIIRTLFVVLVALGIHVQAGTLTPSNLIPSGSGGGKQPQAAISPSGGIYVVFGEKEAVFLTASTDHGKTFSTPSKVADVPGLLLGMRRGPRIAVGANRIVVLAPARELSSFVSDDNGKTWSHAIAVSDHPGSSAEGLDNLTALPDGSFYAVWQDSRSGEGSQIEGARLDAGSTTWGTNVAVYQSPDKKVCSCCHPSVVSDAKGKLTVMWRNLVSGNRDFYFAQSTDRGETFAPAAKLGEGSWEINACPMDGGNLIATPDGVVTIWRRQRSVFTDKPGEPERRLAAGVQPVIGQINGELVAAYQAGVDIALQRTKDATPTLFPSGAFPSLAVSADGKEGVLVWDHFDGGAANPQYVMLH